MIGGFWSILKVSAFHGSMIADVRIFKLWQQKCECWWWFEFQILHVIEHKTLTMCNIMMRWWWWQIFNKNASKYLTRREYWLHSQNSVWPPSTRDHHSKMVSGQWYQISLFQTYNCLRPPTSIHLCYATTSYKRFIYNLTGYLKEMCFIFAFSCEAWQRLILEVAVLKITSKMKMHQVILLSWILHFGALFCSFM